MSLEQDLKNCSFEPNSHNLPIGKTITATQKPHPPKPLNLNGRFTALKPLCAKTHTASLYKANRLDTTDQMWTYLPYGPFDSRKAYQDWLESVQNKADPLFYTITDTQTEEALGLIALAKTDLQNSSIEVAHLAFSPKMQKTVHSTEAVYLLLKYISTLGFRRIEWKCNAQNRPSINAALRLGFTYEGTFRNHMIVKGRNRDTCWFSIIDTELTPLIKAFERWVDVENINEEKIQLIALKHI